MSNFIRVGSSIINLDNVAYIDIETHFVNVYFNAAVGCAEHMYLECCAFGKDSPETKALLYHFNHLHIVPDLLNVFND